LSREFRGSSFESGDGGRVVIGLVGGKADAEVAGNIARQSGLGERVVVLAGGLSLAQMAGLLQRAALFIGGDSGLAHLAVALGTPTVVLFGPSDPMKWGVRGPRHAVVLKKMSCAPCFIFGYHKPCRSIQCMADISVDDVMEGCRSAGG